MGVIFSECVKRLGLGDLTFNYLGGRVNHHPCSVQTKKCFNNAEPENSVDVPGRNWDHESYCDGLCCMIQIVKVNFLIP